MAIKYFYIKPWTTNSVKGFFLIPLTYPKIWALWRSGFLTLPPAIIVFAKASFENPTPSHQWIKDLYEGNAWFAISLTISVFVLSLVFETLEWFSRYIKEKSSDDAPGVMMTKTLASLNSIVGLKSDRLGRELVKAGNSTHATPLSFGVLFDPDIQIKEIVKQIWLLLTTLFESPNFKIVLVSVENSKRTFSAYMPEGGKPVNEICMEEETFLNHVIKTEKFLFIDDISKHVTRLSKYSRKKVKKHMPIPYLQTKSGDASGSICGIPIIDTHLNRVVFVMTIKHIRPRVLAREFEKTHLPTLTHFFNRLVLENRTKLLQSYVHHN